VTTRRRTFSTVSVPGQKRYLILRFAELLFWAFQRITLPGRCRSSSARQDYAATAVPGKSIDSPMPNERDGSEDEYSRREWW
jgi:hypothetical protein